MSSACWGLVRWDLSPLLRLVISQGTVSLFLSSFVIFETLSWCPHITITRTSSRRAKYTYWWWAEWSVDERERNNHPPLNNNVIFLFNVQALTSNVLSLYLWGLASVYDQSAAFSRRKELPSITRLQRSHWGQSAGHQKQGCNWQMGVCLRSGLGEESRTHRKCDVGASLAHCFCQHSPPLLLSACYRLQGHHRCIHDCGLKNCKQVRAFFFPPIPEW